MNFIISVLYEVALWIVALVSIPKLVYNYICLKKYRNSLLERLGFKKHHFKKREDPVIWFHAVSIGETKAIASLARQVKQLMPHCSIFVTSTSETGHAEAKRSLPFADHHFYMPFDFYYVVSRMVKEISPQMVVLSESDFWYNFLNVAKKQGAAIVLVNGKISERSARRFKWVPFFSKRMFGLFDLFCMQNEPYQERLIEVGAPTDKMVVTGNLKFDDEYPQLSPEEITQWKQKLGIGLDQFVITVGSSHNPEEQLIIATLQEISRSLPHIKIILVPRHPERFKLVEGLLEKANLQWVSFSDIACRTGEEQVILIDAMGMLRMCYQLSDVAIVGGSFTDKVGGHNILEPCWYGKPVLFGPHMFTQAELVGLINHYKAGIQVSEGELAPTLLKLLQNSATREALGTKGLQLIKDLKGSTERTLQAMKPLLEKIPPSNAILEG